jgi:hypothetical protein
MAMAMTIETALHGLDAVHDPLEYHRVLLYFPEDGCVHLLLLRGEQVGERRKERVEEK